MLKSWLSKSGISKKWISAISFIFTFALTSFTPIAIAANLPDFTELAEKDRKSVV